jgi:hypothetical protein
MEFSRPYGNDISALNSNQFQRRRLQLSLNGTVNEQGELRNTSFGTAIGDILKFYRIVPFTAMLSGRSMACLSLDYLLGTY